MLEYEIVAFKSNVFWFGVPDADSLVALKIHTYCYLYDIVA